MTGGETGADTQLVCRRKSRRLRKKMRQRVYDLNHMVSNSSKQQKTKFGEYNLSMIILMIITNNRYTGERDYEFYTCVAQQDVIMALKQN